MTESGWLASADPAAMLDFLGRPTARPMGPNHSMISDRKLGLWCAACCYGASSELGRDAEQLIEWNKHPTNNAASWARSCSGDQHKPTLAERAALLRDIVGNPFRPLSVWRNEGKPGLGPIGDYRTDWATPQVVSLATAAYEDRGRKCSCWGFGTDGKPRPAFACSICKGTGTIDDGTLDPFRLALVADALEEAGCAGERCGVCNATGFSWGSEGKCLACKGEGRVPHPLLAHLRGWRRCRACPRENYRHADQCECKATGGWVRNESPHCRGCWAIDLLLGES